MMSSLGPEDPCPCPDGTLIRTEHMRGTAQVGWLEDTVREDLRAEAEGGGRRRQTWRSWT